MTLTEFLLARIAEDEALAREAAESSDEGDPWWEPMELWDAIRGNHNYTRPPNVDDFPDAAFMAARSPLRALLECEAKRQMIDQLERTVDYLDAIRENSAYRFDDVMRRILGPLATVYADHPDFDEKWRP